MIPNNNDYLCISKLPEESPRSSSLLQFYVWTELNTIKKETSWMITSILTLWTVERRKEPYSYWRVHWRSANYLSSFKDDLCYSQEGNREKRNEKRKKQEKEILLKKGEGYPEGLPKPEKRPSSFNRSVLREKGKDRRKCAQAISITNSACRTRTRPVDSSRREDGPGGIKKSTPRLHRKWNRLHRPEFLPLSFPPWQCVPCGGLC